MSDKTKLFDPRGRVRGKAGQPMALTPGYHLVVAVLPDGRFHEVFRLVPDDPTATPEAHKHNHYEWLGDILQLRNIHIPSDDVARGMCRLPEARIFTVGSATNPAAPAHRRRIAAFYLDPMEVSIADYRKLIPAFDYPAEWQAPAGDFPVGFVSWDDAVAYAEAVGKRLPDETEFEYAATDLGRREHPWGEAKMIWTFDRCGKPAFDQIALPGQPPLCGLNSNVAEWTGSWQAPYPGQKGFPPDTLHRVVRGAPLSVARGTPDEKAVAAWTPRNRTFENGYLMHVGLGFRCARSVTPRTRPEDFGAVLP